MNFASIVRVGVILYAVAVTLAQGLPSNNTIDLSATTQNSSVNRIYGGSAADATKYPYIVNLAIKREGTVFTCGGTLISSQFVVTAAHCVDKTDAEMAAFATMGSAVRPVSKYMLHPDYNAVTFENDVAVLKLQTAVTTKGIRLAKADRTTELALLLPFGGGVEPKVEIARMKTP